MKWKDEILKMKYADGGVHFFNPALIVDVLVCSEKYQVTTANREFFTFPIEINKTTVENFLGLQNHKV